MGPKTSFYNATLGAAIILIQADPGGSVLDAWFSGDFIRALLALAAVLAIAIYYLDRRNAAFIKSVMEEQAKREAAMLQRHEKREDDAAAIAEQREKAAADAARAREMEIMALATQREEQNRLDQKAALADQKVLLQWIMDKQAEINQQTAAGIGSMVKELRDSLAVDTGQLRQSISSIVAAHEKWAERVGDTLNQFARNDQGITAVLDNIQAILKENQEAKALRAEFEAYKEVMRRGGKDA